MNLIRQIAAGNQEALETLYQNYKTSVFRIALSVLGDTFLAEDVTQETFLKIQQHADTFRFGDNEKGWVMAIAHNTALHMLEKRKRETLQDEVQVIGITDLSDTIESGEAYQRFCQLLQPLKDLDRQIVCLHLIGELKHREIAVILDLSVGAVKKRYERAIRKIAKHLEENA